MEGLSKVFFLVFNLLRIVSDAVEKELLPLSFFDIGIYKIIYLLCVFIIDIILMLVI